MKERNVIYLPLSGSIINTSSVAGIIGGDSDGRGAAYSASKGAVRSLTKHVAIWYEETISV